MHVRRKLVAGNWKMNGSRAALKELVPIAEAARGAAGVDVAICPPFTLIATAVTRGGGSIRIGAQDCHQAASGAHTGNVSAAMIREAGGRLVIVGHSERRADQHETDEQVRGKATAALSAGLDAVLCVGESEAQRASGDHLATVTRQLAASLPEERGAAELIIAYEPIWAIGTGRTATPADVAEMHAALRRSLAERLGEYAATNMRILYGGSVKAENAAELFALADVDGALVGGASLTAAQFVPIIEAAGRS
ncbi:MAG TPA: triose-phosphate isomerase [Allosphingosinicella sp.]|nr:triose-phosphate isomerase [Allosphingosinicella sp.]